MEYLQQNVKPEDVGYTVEDYIKKANELVVESEQCRKAAFDMVVRKVIDSGLIYKKCNHKYVQENDGKGDFKEYGKLQSFMYRCNQCMEGVNRHDCHIEGESYYMTCNEARVVNMAATNYGLDGEIRTATRFRD